MLKKLAKRILLTIAAVLLLLLSLPFLVMYFGSESAATSTKVILNALVGYGIDSPSPQLMDKRFHLPEGFSVSVYATGLGKARMLHMTQHGDLLVSLPTRGEVMLFGRDNNGDRKPDQQRVLLSGLTRPHGLEVVNGGLYVAESKQIGRVDFDERSGKLAGPYKAIITGLGDEGNHWTKSIRAGDDGWMYVSAGSTCNVCEESDVNRAAISRFKLEPLSAGEAITLKPFATGLRNSVGLDWSPWDKALYATDHGRDLLGDDYPPCELNKVVEKGFYGWPYINGFADLDPELGEGKELLLKTALSPIHGFRAHNAPLGMRFIRHGELPAKYQKAALVALHGSWNRSEQDGYKVVSLHWQADGTVIEKDFMSGFLRSGERAQGDHVIGRPVDIAQGHDGVFYISDDYSGTIYRVAYKEPALTEPLLAKNGLFNSLAPLNKPESVLASMPEEKRMALKKQGQALFRQYRCGNCHDPRLARGRVVRPLDKVAEKYSEQSLADFFLSPTPPMPLFPLDESQRQALAVYLLNL